MTIAEMIRECHARFGEREHSPTLLSPTRTKLRQDMLEEEVREMAQAILAGDLVEVADALGDIVYVAYGTAFAYGIPLDKVLAEIHRANMSKDFTGAEGEDKKLIKGDRYQPPNLVPILETTPPTQCPDCGAPEPRLHPATGADGGEVAYICPNAYHSGTDET